MLEMSNVIGRNDSQSMDVQSLSSSDENHDVHTHLMGGCIGTRYGCCSDRITARENRKGTNCVPALQPHKPIHEDVEQPSDISSKAFIAIVVLALVLLLNVRSQSPKRKGGFSQSGFSNSRI